MTILSRRRFLSTSALALLGAPLLRAIEPFEREGGPRLRLSLAAYSFRDSFQKGNPPLTFEKFLDACAGWGVEGAELTSYYFPKDVTGEQLALVRRHAHLRGVSVSGTSVGNTLTHPPGEVRDAEIATVKKWVDRAVILGAPHLRVFAGAIPEGGNLAGAKKACIEGLEECAEYAGQHGIFLGVENHLGIAADPLGLLDIIQSVKSPWVGVNLDSANFLTDDPYADFARVAPYAVNVQLKTEIKPKGQSQPADLARLLNLLRDADYQGWVALEYEAAEDPWKAVPRHLATLKKLIYGDNAAVAVGAWIPLFDGLALGKWKETEFSGRAAVEVKDARIILGAGGDLTGITLPEPPARMDYEVEFQAMRVEGDDFFCGFTFPVGDTFVTFIAGGWGGTVTGISNVNSSSANENETTQFRDYKNGKWYLIRVRVTKDKIVVWMDREQIVKLETEGKKLDLRLGEIESSKPFGFATFRTKAALRNLRWRKL